MGSRQATGFWVRSSVMILPEYRTGCSLPSISANLPRIDRARIPEDLHRNHSEMRTNSPFARRLEDAMTLTIAPAPNDSSPAAARLRSVDLSGPAGRLEGILNEGAPDAPFAALVCHPHPLGGGSMHNKVVYHSMKALNDPAWELGLPVL